MFRRGLLAALVGLVILCSLSAAPVRAADVTWNKGNSWEYSWSATEQGMFAMDGSMEMKVGRSTTDSYVLTLSGSATVSGTFENMSISGNGDISGSMTRAKATFGSMSTSLIMNMSMASGVLTITMGIGVMTTASPALNDLPINQNLVPGTHIWSNSTVTGTAWFNMVGFINKSKTISSTEHLELVVGTNETVTTPAGTFECVKLSAGSGSEAVTYYYSDKVGNYVKMTGSGSMDTGYAALGNLTLKSYSYGKGTGGIMSFITGKNWWVAALIIVVIVVIVVGLIAMRRRGRVPQMAPPPAQEMAPPPPYQG